MMARFKKNFQICFYRIRRIQHSIYRKEINNNNNLKNF